MAEKIVQDVTAAHDALVNAVKAARAAGYAVSFQSNGGVDYYPVVTGGPVEEQPTVTLPLQQAPSPAVAQAQPVPLAPTAKDVTRS